MSRRPTAPTSAPTSAPSVSRLQQVLRAGLTLGMDGGAEGRNLRQRTAAGPSTPEFAVTIAVPKMGLLAEGDPQLRTEYGVSTDVRWTRTPQTLWREMASVEYTRLPKHDETSLSGIVSLAKDAMMHEYRDDYIALYDRLEGALQEEPARLRGHRDVIIAQRESLEAFLCLRSAIKPREGGNPRFLAIPADNDTGTEAQNEKMLHMYLLMGEVVKALENGTWHSQGTVQGDMAQHIRKLEAEIDPLENEQDAAAAAQRRMAPQQPDRSF